MYVPLSRRKLAYESLSHWPPTTHGGEQHSMIIWLGKIFSNDSQMRLQTRKPAKKEQYRILANRKPLANYPTNKGPIS